MQANIFKPDTPFKLGDLSYIIQTVKATKTDTELYCKPYDTEIGKPENTRNAAIFSASELKRLIYNDEASILDRHCHRYTALSLTDKQIQQQEMWVEFCYFHIDRCRGERLQSEALVDESIDLFDWHAYGSNAYGRSSCQEKISAFTHSQQDPRTLVNWGGASDKGQTRLPEPVEQVILECIVEYYLVRKDEKEYSKNKIADLIIEQVGLRKSQEPDKYSVIPSKATIYNRFDALEPLTVAEKQLSKQEQKRLKRKLIRQFVGKYPLDRVEMDAIYVAIGLLDDDGKTYLGSAVIMVAIDTFTRAVVGYAMDVGENVSESADLAVECLKHSVYKKDNPDWQMCGPMTKVVHDASTAIRGNLFKKTALDLGVYPITVRSNEPWAKPFIERFFLTLRLEFLSEQPGYLGSKLFRGTRHLNLNDTLENHAQLTVSEFKRKFEEFITDYYHESGHGGLNYRSPNDVWNYEVNENGLIAKEPNITNDIGSYRGIQVSDRALYEQGYIKLENEIYRDDALKKLHLLGVRSVTVQYSNIDAASVVIPVEHKTHQKALGRTIIIAERRETSYQSISSLRSSLNAARNGVNAHLEKKGKKRYPPGKGIKPLSKKKSEDAKNGNSTIDNTKSINMDAPDAKDQIDKATQSWTQSEDTDTSPSPNSQQSNIEITVGEEL